MKRFFAVLLCVLFLLLSACASVGEDKNTPSSTLESVENSATEASNDISETSAAVEQLIGSEITVTNHSKITDHNEIKETTEYSNGIKVETLHYYFDETLEQINFIFVDVTRDGKYIYKSNEYYNENGELEIKSFYSYNDEGELLEVVERDYRNHHQTKVSSNDGKVQHIYIKDADSFQIKLHDENGDHTKTYIDGEMIGYEKTWHEGNVRLFEVYGKNMKLLRKTRYGNGDDDSWEDHYLDDGRILRVTTESDSQSFWNVLWVYTDDVSEMKRITDFNMETHEYSFYDVHPADGITESKAEEYLAEYITALKAVKEIEKLWGIEYYGWEDVDW